MRFLLLMFPILLANCGLTKRNTVCEDEAIVIDQSEVDGCGLLLQLNNGKKLFPMNGTQYGLKTGEKLMISYHAESAASICMLEDEIVSLTCVSRKSISNCQPYRHIDEAEWLRILILDQNPSQVIRYKYQDQYLYQLIAASNRTWYDCTGQLVCGYSEDCKISSTTITDSLLIYQAHR